MTQYVHPPAGHDQRVFALLADRLQQAADELVVTTAADERPEGEQRGQGPPARNSPPVTSKGGE